MRRHYWEWPIATYLFLGGMGGGMFFLNMVLSFFVFPEQAETLGAVLMWPMFLAIVWLAFGCFLLVFELGQHYTFPRVFLNSTKSVIGHGARLLVVCMVFGLLWWISFCPWFHGFLAGFRGINLFLAGITGLCIMLYTGIMFSSLKAHSFWATPALPVLFTVSALSTACACIMLSAGWWLPVPAGSAEALPFLAFGEQVEHLLHNTDIILALSEITVLMLIVLSYLGAGNVVAHGVAVRWVKGKTAPVFWVCMVGLGLVVPLLLNILPYAGGHVAACILVIAGGLLLRFLIVYADERAEVPGETRYFTRLPEPDAEFITKWTYGENIF